MMEKCFHFPCVFGKYYKAVIFVGIYEIFSGSKCQIGKQLNSIPGTDVVSAEYITLDRNKWEVGLYIGLAKALG